MTLDEYNALLLAQGAACALCLAPQTSGARLCIDHCHDTGKVRGLLCATCNSAIGLLGDTAERVQRAVEYLRGDISKESK